ncbi:MAG: metallophosphoesterase family protein [Victivallales bacterium]|nr:metallophosphoesterase family protein [Victivallales bacterium]
MDKIKIALLGDIHANLEAFNAVMEKIKTLEVTHYVCIGDIVGYNANPKECLDMMRALNPVATVRGNHDEYVGTEQDLYGFNPSAAAAVNWTRSQLTKEDRKYLAELPYSTVVRIPGVSPFSIVHGTMDNPHTWGYIFTRLQAVASMENQRPYKLCFFGHTHMPLYFVEKEYETQGFFFQEDAPISIEPNSRYLINVGSVGQPRDGIPTAAFTIYTPDENKVELYRVEYDIETCQQKIRDAGLPEKLASRLEIGR